MNDPRRSTSRGRPGLVRAVLAALVLFATGAASCGTNGPTPARGIGSYDPAALSQVLFADDALHDLCAVGDVRVERVPHSNVLRVYVPIRNLTDRELQLQVMCEFFDAAGNPYQDETGRKTVYIPRNGMKTWTASSMQSKADDFVVTIWRFVQP